MVVLVVTSVASACLILLPLVRLHRSEAAHGARLFTLLYFAGIGLGFMGLEIGYMEVLRRGLSNPVRSMAVVLGTFLAASGCGCLVSGRWTKPGRAPVAGAFGAMVVVVMADLVGLNAGDLVGGLATPTVRAVLRLAPMGFLMGFFFPAGIRLIERGSRGLIPWAWGINGCASVVGASLAGVVATAVGLDWLRLGALGGYTLAAGAFVLASRGIDADL